MHLWLFKHMQDKDLHKIQNTYYLPLSPHPMYIVENPVTSWWLLFLTFNIALVGGCLATKVLMYKVSCLYCWLYSVISCDIVYVKDGINEVMDAIPSWDSEIFSVIS